MTARADVVLVLVVIRIANVAPLLIGRDKKEI